MTAHEKYLILGSNSFSGATFADFLATEGLDVLATSRSDEPHEAFLPYKWQKRPGNVRFRRIDLNHDLDALKTLLASERPTHIVNFAAQSMVGESWLHPDRKSTRLNSSHSQISYAVFCLKKKNNHHIVWH